MKWAMHTDPAEEDQCYLRNMSKGATDLRIATAVLLSLALFFTSGITLDNSFNPAHFCFLKKEIISFCLVERWDKF
jgi:hypothetical protein